VIRSLMQIALKGRAVIIGLAIALLLSGIYAFSQIDIEAYPDPVQPMVEVLTLPSGLSAEEVERLVTVPLEYTLSTTRNLEAMRSISLFSLSDIRCYFSWDSDYYWDHSETVNQLQFVSLPPGIAAGISPENSIGEIYRYTVESPEHDLLNEKTVNDWIVSRQLSTVPGVIGDSTFGGLTKQYHVDVDPQKLEYYHVPLSALTSALTNANLSSGGNYLDVGEQAFDVRGLGFIESLDDIRNTLLSVKKSTPTTAT
jgi:cobalt-zinc-cadmium resistance protein CzcA